ncbi:cytochrome P450 [Halteromyces radiatus]|uniref:cytochrome P450 n=1 Tax=Halteromyces radiatus TaxID=101107 RepID=UPI00221FE456|nr:cytochrome P450 [Halteromyces radiatus]KAI8099826.1 cytochrome P450 [Halteromyces radiatus]
MDSLAIRHKVEHWFGSYVPQHVEKKQVKTIGSAIIITWISYKITSKLYDAYFGNLSGIPGPFYAKFFSIPRAFTDIPRGTSYRRMKALHEKYGTVVKINPTTIAVSDKDWIKEILVKDDLPKGPAYSSLQDDDGQTLFNTRDKVFHKQRRRIVSPAFAIKYLNSLEPFMDSCTEAFIHRIDRDIAQTMSQPDGFGTVDIWSLLACLALDIIGNTAFGESFNMVDTNDHFIPLAISKGMRFAPKLIMYPFLGTLVKIFHLNSSPQFDKFMRDLITKRLTSHQRRDDILQILIDTQQASHQEDRLTVDAIIGEVILFLIAGSETTSNTTGFAIIELLRHPDKMERLRAEVDTVPLEEKNLLHTHNQLKHLPFLNAVINETMRLNTIASNGLQRITDSDIVLGGKLFVPKNTVVICSLNHAQRNPAYWPRAEEFLPERWLDDAETPPCLDAFYPFSAGTRNCIGKQFALQEMRITLAMLIRRYEFKAIPEELEHAKDVRQFITLTVEKNSFKVLMKKRNI